MNSIAANSSLKGHSFAAAEDEKRVRTQNYRRLILVITMLCAIISILIYAIALYAGAEISRAGHTPNTNKHMIIIGDDVVKLPLNNIRYPSQRRNQTSKRLDLYFVWPDLKGYSEEIAHVFNDLESRNDIIFATLEPRYSAFDMSGRLEPIYRKFFMNTDADEIGYGLIRYKLNESAGFLSEELLVQEKSPYPFVARCTTLNIGVTTPYCIRDIHVGKNLSLTYRFHVELIAKWYELDEALRNKFKIWVNNSAATNRS